MLAAHYVTAVVLCLFICVFVIFGMELVHCTVLHCGTLANSCVADYYNPRLRILTNLYFPNRQMETVLYTRVGGSGFLLIIRQSKSRHGSSLSLVSGFSQPATTIIRTQMHSHLSITAQPPIKKFWDDSALCKLHRWAQKLVESKLSLLTQSC